MWLVTTDSFPGYWGRGDTLPEAVANARGAGGKAPWVAHRLADGWVEATFDGLTISARYTGEQEDSLLTPMVAEAFRVSRGGTISPR